MIFILLVDKIPTTSPTVQPTSTRIPISIIVSLGVSGTNTAGEIYSLVCHATVTGSTDQPTITWMDPNSNPVPYGIITTAGSISTLTFSPLAISDAGTYTCNVNVEGVIQAQTYNVTVVVNGKCISVIG